MTPLWISILALAEPIMLLMIGVGGYLGLKSGLAKAEIEVQERVRQALHEENSLLQSQVKRLEVANRRLDRVMQLIIDALKRTHGIDLEITDDMVTIRDGSGTHISRLSNGLTP